MDSANAGEWVKAAEEVMQEPALIQSRDELAEIVNIMRGAFAKVKELENLLTAAGMYPEDSFQATLTPTRRKIASIASPLVEMYQNGELKGADQDFHDAVNYSDILWGDIEELWRFYDTVKSIKELSEKMEMELDNYKNVQ